MKDFFVIGGCAIKWIRRLNPFDVVWCRNTDADEADYRYVARWRLWLGRFQSGYAGGWQPCFVERNDAMRQAVVLIAAVILFGALMALPMCWWGMICR